MLAKHQSVAYKLGWMLLLGGSSGLFAAAFGLQAVPSSSPERPRDYLGTRFFPLASSDVGNPAVPGSARAAENTLEITAGGKDIWGTADEFHFNYQQQTGDFDVNVRVVSLSAPHLYTKAGVMARESLSPGSRHVFLLVFPDNRPRHLNTGGFEFQYRDQASLESKAIYPPQAGDSPAFPVEFPNAWLRLRRDGKEFAAFVSTDGRHWRTYATHSLDLPDTIFLGVALTAHVQEASATAQFKDFGNTKEAGK